MSLYSPKFTITKAALSELLDSAAVVVRARGDLLKSFQIKALDTGEIQVAATDLQLSYVASTQWVDIVRPGITVIPANKLRAIVNSAGSDSLEFDVQDRLVNIKAGPTKWTLALKFNIRDYPPLPEIDTLYETYRGAELLTALKTVRASMSDSMENLKSVQILGGKVRASDRARLQEVDLPEFPLDIVIPGPAVDDLVKLLAGVEDVGIAETNTHLLFALENDTRSVYIVNKSTYAFPDVDAQIMRPVLLNSEQLGVARDDLLAALGRVRINADLDTSAVLMVMSGDELTLSAKDAAGNTSTETIVVSWGHKPREVAVNAKMLVEVVKTHSLECTFWFGEDSRGQRPSVLIRDDHQIGIVPQMHKDWM